MFAYRCKDSKSPKLPVLLASKMSSGQGTVLAGSSGDAFVKSPVSSTGKASTTNNNNKMTIALLTVVLQTASRI